MLVSQLLQTIVLIGLSSFLTVSAKAPAPSTVGQARGSLSQFGFLKQFWRFEIQKFLQHFKQNSGRPGKGDSKPSTPTLPKPSNGHTGTGSGASTGRPSSGIPSGGTGSQPSATASGSGSGSASATPTKTGSGSGTLSPTSSGNSTSMGTATPSASSTSTSVKPSTTVGTPSEPRPVRRIAPS